MSAPTKEQADVSRIGAPLPDAEPVALPDDPEAVRKLAEYGIRVRQAFEQHDAKMQQAKAERAERERAKAAEERASKKRKKANPNANLAAELLSNAAHMALAIRRVAWLAQEWEQDDMEHAFVLFEGAATSIGRAVEASRLMLTGDAITSRTGHFDDALDEAAEQHARARRDY